ncbi:MAG TPA: zf-HC2 domain-containing protein [Gemmatimonadales bacterium]|nr:zf-HC2 domain-containing protein [Gemmatimonadales bacterium]
MTERIDCDRALAELQDYLRREESPGLTPLIEAHLERCAPCFRHASFERNFLEMLGSRGAGIRCPDTLRQRILDILRRQAP